MNITTKSFFAQWVNYLHESYTKEIGGVFDIDQLEQNLQDIFDESVGLGLIKSTDLVNSVFFEHQLPEIVTLALEMSSKLPETDKQKLLEMLNQSIVEHKGNVEIKLALEAGEATVERKKPLEIIDTRSEETKKNFTTRKL